MGKGWPIVGGQTAAGAPADSGYRTVPHTADLRVEAWAGTAEGCIAAAVHGMVAGFADTSDVWTVADRECRISADTAEDLLVAVLEEVVFRMDTDGELPLDTVVGPIRAEPHGRSALVRFRMADARALAAVGAVPKAVSLHDLRLRGGTEGWTCQVTLDV